MSVIENLRCALPTLECIRLKIEHIISCIHHILIVITFHTHILWFYICFIATYDDGKYTDAMIAQIKEDATYRQSAALIQKMVGRIHTILVFL